MPSLIPSQTIAQMRRLRTATLLDTCAIKVRTQSDVSGGVTESLATVLTLPCRVQKPSRGTLEQFAAGQLTSKPDAEVAFAPGTEIDPTVSILACSGIIATDAGNVAWARTFEVIGDTGATSVSVERVYPVREV